MAEKHEMDPAKQAEERDASQDMPKEKKRKGRKRKTIRRIIWTAVILLVLGVTGWSVISGLQAQYRITYDPYTATTCSISNSLSFSGSLQLVNSAAYTAASDGKVREVYVSAGDRVKSGDRLLRLSGGETFEAEFDGTVSTIDVKKGDEVKAGDSLVTVADFDQMVVSVRVGESNVGKVSVGQSCRVTVSSAGAVFEAEISKIDYVSYTGNNVAYYTTTVPVDTSSAENVWPGMQATVTVPLEEAENVTVLKMEALSTARDNTAYVYKEDENGDMVEVPVTVGVSNGNYVEIREGVMPGETVYKVAEKTEEETGIASLLSGLFTNRQVNQRRNRNGQNGNGFSGGSGMPDFSSMPSGGFPGGGSGGSGFPGGGSSGGGTRGN